MADYYLAVCHKHKEYVDLEKWDPTTQPTNLYREFMRMRLEQFKKLHVDCHLVFYSDAGWSSDGSEFPDTDKLGEFR